MHTKCIPHFNKRLYTFCIKNLAAKDILVLYTKCIQKFVEMWDTFCIHQLYTSCTTFVCKMYIYTISVREFGIHSKKGSRYHKF